MRRREFASLAAGAIGIGVAGCLGGDGSAQAAEIALLELENHRQADGYEFSLEIETDDEIAFETTRELGPAGSGTETAAFEDPVDPGSYVVTVEVDEYAATAETESLITDDEQCLRLQFYLGAATLHWEHTAYDECE